MPRNTKGFKGNSLIKKAGEQIAFTPDQLLEIMKCRQDPIYFCEKYVKIVHPDKGLISFKLFDFQKTVMETVQENRFTICKIPRQSGKTTAMGSLLLWYIIFHDQLGTCILADRQKTANETLSKVKKSYEHLPKWLQQGVVEWNKGSIVLENGSRIVADSTSGSSIRGWTFSIVVLDEFAHIRPELQQDFFTSVYPVISAGKTTKIIMISTPKGIEEFYKIWVDAEQGRNDFVPIDVHWSEIPGRNEKWKEETISNIGQDRWNQEFSCEFIGSTRTLISPSKLKSLAIKTPLIRTPEGFSVYKKPIKDHVYLATIDSSHGKEQDFSVVSVFDITEAPYELVAVFKSNVVSALFFPHIIEEIAKKYNEAFVLIEINDVGERVAHILFYELEYENMMTTDFRGRAGQKLTGGFGQNLQLGLRVSNKVKKVGCTTLKTLIEKDMLFLWDFDAISELYSFVPKGGNFAAESGKHDDVVMTMVMFAWVSTQDYFSELMDQNLRVQIFDKQIEEIEQSLCPFGVVNNGLNQNKQVEDVDEDGTVWYKV